MACVRISYCKTTLFGYLSQRTAYLSYPVSTSKYIHKTLCIRAKHRIHIPARAPNNSGQLPVERDQDPHAHHDRHLWHLRMLWQRPRPATAREREGGAKRYGRPMEREDSDRDDAFCVHLAFCAEYWWGLSRESGAECGLSAGATVEYSDCASAVDFSMSHREEVRLLF